MRFLLLIILCLCPLAASAADSVSGLPIPRFVSLRGDETNWRTGPGFRYPIDWVFRRQGLPVEVTAEVDVWRRIRDTDGAEGWVHQNMLSGKRGALIVGKVRDLRAAPDDSAPIKARLAVGVVAELRECMLSWCYLRVQGYKGWLKKSEFFGAYKDEVFD